MSRRSRSRHAGQGRIACTHAVGAAFALALTTLCGSVRADDQQRAEELFDEARKLMRRRGTLDQGCAKLEESLRLWDRGDTVLNLALCHRMQGKTATAWAEFDRAITHGIKVRFPEAIVEAKKQREELEAKLSRLTVTVSPATAKLPGLTVEVGGAAWPRERWNIAREIDPGPVRVKARAEGYQPFEVEVQVGAEKDTKTVVVALEPVPPAPPPAPPQPVWPFIVGGIGLALGAAALTSEVIAMKAHRELDTRCGDDRKECPVRYDFGPARTRELLGFGLFVGLGATSVLALGAAGVGLGLAPRAKGTTAPKAASRPARSLTPSFSLVLSPTSIGVRSTF